MLKSCKKWRGHEVRERRGKRRKTRTTDENPEGRGAAGLLSSFATKCLNLASTIYMLKLKHGGRRSGSMTEDHSLTDRNARARA